MLRDRKEYRATEHWHKYICPFNQYLRKPIWGYPCPAFLQRRYGTGGIRPELTQGMMLPWVFPRLVTSASMRRIPRRSCDSSQRADRVGSDRDVQVDVSHNEPVLLIKKSGDTSMSGSSFARKRNTGNSPGGGISLSTLPGFRGNRYKGRNRYYSRNAGSIRALFDGAGSRVGLPDRQVISLQSRIHLKSSCPLKNQKNTNEKD